MIDVTLAPIPNQNLTITIDGARFNFTIKCFDNIATYSISINDKEILSNFRFIDRQLCIPYNHLSEFGNFYLYTNGEDIDYLKFNKSQFLYYLTNEEVAELNG